MRVVMTGADGFLGWAAAGDRARQLFGQSRELPGLNPRTPCSVGPPEKPIAAMSPSGR
jgi:hypothetical protein